MNKKYIIYGICGLIAIALLAIVFRSCGPGDTHKDESREVKKELELVKAREVVANAALIKLSNEIDKRDSAIIALKTKKDITEGQLNDSKNISFRLSQQLRAAKTDKDTVRYILNCDSLSDEMLNLQGVIISYEQYTDTIAKIYDAQLRAKDQVIQNRIELYGQLRTSFDKVELSYQSVYSDYKKEIKHRKKARTLNRVLAAVVLLIGGAYIMK